MNNGETTAFELSVVIPAFNEESRIESGLARIIEFLTKHQRSAEVIVVDDGSQDSTFELAQKALSGSGLSHQILVNETNRGKGYSVRRGVLAATGQIVLFTDTDLSTPIDELIKLEAAIANGADVAIGSRDTAGAEVIRHQAWYREVAGKSFNLVVQALALPGINDSQCGFKLFRRESTHVIFKHQTIEGWGFDAELLFLAKKFGLTIEEVPVRWFNDDRSKVNLLRDGVTMLLDLLRIRWRHRHPSGPDH